MHVLKIKFSFNAANIFLRVLYSFFIQCTRLKKNLIIILENFYLTFVGNQLTNLNIMVLQHYL